METRLRELRETAGYEKRSTFCEELTHWTGREYKELTYRSWELGYREANYRALLDIADFLGCTVDEILGRDPERRGYVDPVQRELNECYEALDRSSQKMLASVATSFAADPSRRVSKSRQGAGLSKGQGEVA